MPEIRAFRDDEDPELWRVTYEGDDGRTLARFLFAGQDAERQARVCVEQLRSQFTQDWQG